ncbi:hypothetical protein SAMN05421810_105243 [Amycolatopsis arida]|uniref:Uncharacterized protein n=1 Tax=Amycolatopsis arida TaxID=587909 RepID=A0A1I5WRM1_9PSEU|nr:hypothetical protein [Amycolatopsis arida]TDX92417.1 hypothetical protein CLV69_105262 [Amycolatopsis arida]SFQ22423.1 hypothetical protein SAMN05421810_105243 [Amycolatopsis arida]
MNRRGGIGAVRASVWLLVVWTLAAQTAVLLAGLIGFAEVRASCAGPAELSFRAAISVRCADGREIPMNGVAAVVLFAGFGLVVTVLLAVFHAAARAAERRAVPSTGERGHRSDHDRDG